MSEWNQFGTDRDLVHISAPFLWLEALRSTMMDVLISKVYRFYILEKTRIDSVGP